MPVLKDNLISAAASVLAKATHEPANVLTYVEQIQQVINDERVKNRQNVANGNVLRKDLHMPSIPKSNALGNVAVKDKEYL